MTERLNSLDWDDLRIFLQAARSGSVAKAARQLAVNHSTVSRRLARLEFAMGASLFERGREGLILTAAGATALRHIEDIETGARNLRSAMSGGGEVGGSVRLATMEGFASLYLAQRLPAFLADYAGLHVELVTSPQTVRVTRREADLFVSFFKPTGTAIVSERIGAFATGLYASPAYLAEHGPPATAADLEQHRFVGYIEELVLIDTVRWLDELVPSPPMQMTSNSMIAQIGAAEGGAGIVVLPRFAIGERSPLVPVLPDQLRGRRDLWLTTHQDLRSAERVRAVSQFLKRQIAADPHLFSTSEP